MGCSGSKDGAEEHEGKQLGAAGHNVATNHLPTTGPLSAKDYKSRLASSEGTQTVYFPQTGMTIRYAFVSQRGYYPGSPDKANQDSLCVHTHFGGDPEQVLFGVFDGHGEYGTQCSQFAKDKVPENLLSNTHFSVSPEIAYHRAMVLANNQLHRLPDVDDSMSGTTAIALLVRSKTVYVANVGDSRAVLAELQGDRLVAQDLSFDQTPFRRDECERVKRCGARVLTLDQLEGLKDPNVEYWGTEEENDGDPPRLWAPNATYPGTAFTRSIGDSAAERIGVFAEPEIVSRNLTANHPFLVLASDGVWEFLPSQSVVDMVSKFDDPQEACLSVVAESYRLWLQHETRTDDITMMVVQFQGIKEDATYNTAPTPAGALMDYSSRPGGLGSAMKRLPSMRMAPIESMPSTLSHAMLMPALSMHIPAHATNVETMLAAALAGRGSNAGTSMQGGSIAGAGSSTSPFANGAPGGEVLTEQDIQFLDRAVVHNFLFSHLSAAERRAVYSVMQRVPVQNGQLVIRQGDAGDHYYIVQSGLFDVYLQQMHHNPPELVYTYGQTNPDPNAPPAPPASFGELALLYSKSRAATVVARTDGSLWSLSREDFRAALQAVVGGVRDLSPLVRALRGVEVLQCLSGSQLSALAAAMKESTFTDGQHIIRQGEEGSDFYLVHTGEVACTVRKNPDDANETPKEVLRLSAGQFFGERALLAPAKRAANVTASGTVTLLHIGRDAFQEVMGVNLQDIINAEGNWHGELAMQRQVLARKNASALHLQGNLQLDDLVARGLLFATDCSALMLMEHKTSEEIFTVRVTSVGDVAAANKQALVLRARDITRSLEPSFFVPGVLNHFKDNRILAEVLMTVGLCTLDMLMAEGPLDELSSMFVAASIVLGLEHLHWSHIMYRGLSVHSVLVTEGGQVQLVDFRFARKDDARAYTLCGNPEYLAPEVVEQRGHSCAVDLWALGVLIHCLLTGETPFAQPGEDELRIYRRICKSEAPPLAEGLSPEAQDLLTGLLTRDPAHRLGAGPCGLADLKAHPWFQPIDWQALLEHRYPPPPGIRERIYNFEGVAYAHFEPQPYDGDTRWCNDF